GAAAANLAAVAARLALECAVGGVSVVRGVRGGRVLGRLHSSAVGGGLVSLGVGVGVLLGCGILLQRLNLPGAAAACPAVVAARLGLIGVLGRVGVVLGLRIGRVAHRLRTSVGGVLLGVGRRIGPLAIECVLWQFLRLPGAAAANLAAVAARLALACALGGVGVIGRVGGRRVSG